MENRNEKEMENQQNESLSTVDEINRNAQPEASSTPEFRQNSSGLRRSNRVKPIRTPCGCCKTYGHIRGRRPLHSPRQSKTPKARRTVVVPNETWHLSTTSAERNR